MKNKSICLLALLCLVLTTNCFAQDAEMADTMRSEGKIYVVVAIILVILVGFVLYLFLQDRKLGKLEKLISERENQTR